MFAAAKLVRRFVPDLFKGQLPARHPRLPAVALLTTMAQMQRAVVKSLPDEPNLTITLTVGGKQRNLDRPKAEPLEKPLARLQKSAAAPPDKRARRAAAATAPAAPPETPLVALHDGPTPDHPLIDPGATPNEAAWRHGRLLQVGATSYLIDVNPPLAERVDVHGTVFVGVPAVGVPKLLFAREDECRWRWARRRPDTAATAWEDIPGAEAQWYTPTAEDTGCMLRVTCVPTRRDPSSPDGDVALGDAVHAETGPVAPALALSSGAGRHELTPTHLPLPFFRIVSYNILADQYASTDAARTQIFASCPPSCLVPEYRRPLVLAELLGYNADVMCLQEVDDKAFTQLLEPALRLAGFEGVYTNKAGKVREGAATFWRRDKFRMLARRDVTLKELYPSTPEAGAVAAAPHGAAFEPMLRTSPALCTALQKVATIAQLTLLAPVEDVDGCAGGNSNATLRPLCIANTHLFFHYAAPHIRTMHVWSIMREAAALVDAAAGGDPALTDAAGGRRPALVFCGDLNSDLNDGIPGAIQLLAGGSLPDNYWDWAFGVNFKWERDEEGGDDKEAQTGGSSGIQEGGEVQKMLHTDVEGLRPSSPRSPAETVPGVALTAPFRLAAADRLRSNVTNYVKGYDGLLDYVFYERDKIAVDRVIPVPPTASLGGYLPNAQYPSDHLAVVADLRFEASGGSGGGKGGAGSSGGAGKAGGSGADSFGDSIGGPGSVLPADLYNVGVAADVLARGGVIAVPTDTLYGLAAAGADETAVSQVYDIKSRAAHKPLAICVADHEDIPRYVVTDHFPQGLLSELLPGPVTVLLVRREGAPLAAALNPGVDTLGVRIPDCRFIRAVARQHAGALALTSANVSGDPSCVSPAEFQPLWQQLSAVFDGGEIPGSRAGSTIVDLTTPGVYRITREGEGLAALTALLEGKYGYTRQV